MSYKSYVYLTDNASQVFNNAVSGPKVKITHFMPIYDLLIDKNARDLTFTGGNETKYNNTTGFERQYNGRRLGMDSIDNLLDIQAETALNAPAGQYIIRIPNMQYRISTDADGVIINDILTTGMTESYQRPDVRVNLLGDLPLVASFKTTTELSQLMSTTVINTDYSGDIGSYPLTSISGATFNTITPHTSYAAQLSSIFEPNSNKVYVSAEQVLLSNVNYRTANINISDNSTPDYRTVGVFTCAISAVEQLGSFKFNKIAMFATSDDGRVYYVGSVYMINPIEYESTGASNNEIIIDIVIDFQANDIDGVTNTAKFYGNEFAFWSYTTGANDDGSMDSLHAYQRIFIGTDNASPEGGVTLAQHHVSVVGLTGVSDDTHYDEWFTLVNSVAEQYGYDYGARTDIIGCASRIDDTNPNDVIKYWQTINAANDYEFFCDPDIAGRFVFNKSIIPLTFNQIGTAAGVDEGTAPSTTIDLGSRRERFRTSYTKSLNTGYLGGYVFDGNPNGDVMLSASLTPSTNEQYDIGTQVAKIRSIYVGTLNSDFQYTNSSWISNLVVEKLEGFQNVIKYVDSQVSRQRSTDDYKQVGIQFGTGTQPIKAAFVHALFSKNTSGVSTPIYMFGDLIPGTSTELNAINILNGDGSVEDSGFDYTGYTSAKNLGNSVNPWTQLHTKSIYGYSRLGVVVSEVVGGIGKFSGKPSQGSYLTIGTSIVPSAAFAQSIGREYSPFNETYTQKTNTAFLGYMLNEDTQTRRETTYTTGTYKWSTQPVGIPSTLPVNTTEFDFLYTTLDTDLIPSASYRSQIGAPGRGIRAVYVHDLYGGINSNGVGSILVHNTLLPGNASHTDLKNPEGFDIALIDGQDINIGSVSNRFDHSYAIASHAISHFVTGGNGNNYGVFGLIGDRSVLSVNDMKVDLIGYTDTSNDTNSIIGKFTITPQSGPAITEYHTIGTALIKFTKPFVEMVLNITKALASSNIVSYLLEEIYIVYDNDLDFNHVKFMNGIELVSCCSSYGFMEHKYTFPIINFGDVLDDTPSITGVQKCIRIPVYIGANSVKDFLVYTPLKPVFTDPFIYTVVDDEPAATEANIVSSIPNTKVGGTMHTGIICYRQ